VRPRKVKGLAQDTVGAYHPTAAGGGFWVLPACPVSCIMLTLQLACGLCKLEALPWMVMKECLMLGS